MSARVIPPLTGASPTITAAQLTATSLPEVAPAAWNSGTTYASGATASVAAGVNNALDVYQSIPSGNLGHAPASSPTFWKLLGRTYPAYADGTYALNDRVIDPATHLEYLSLVPANTAALTDETKWQLQGYANRWRAFDILRNTKASGPSGTYFTITPGQRVDAIGLAGLAADSFTISLKVGGVELWSYSETLSTRNTQSWSDYFFGAFTYRDVTAVFDIPKYSGAEITITFFRSAGDISVGGIWINEAVYLGELETEPGVDRRNFSTVDRQADGTIVLIQRRTIPKNSWITYIDKARLPKVKPLPDVLNAVPAMWVGLTDSTDEYFDLVTLVAVYTRFTITPGHPDARIDLDLEET